MYAWNLLSIFLFVPLNRKSLILLMNAFVFSKPTVLLNNSNSTHALIGHKTILHDRM